MAAQGVFVLAPPRPQDWETPDLKDETKYFIQPPAANDSVADRLLDCLTSFPATDPTGPTRPMLETFLRAQLDFNDDDSWDAHQMLGAGSYGRAGLWVQRDPTYRILDEIVVKEQEDLDTVAASKYSEDKVTQPFRGLLAEAVILKQMNEYRCENIIHMRGYAYVTNNYTAVPPRSSNIDYRDRALRNGWRTRRLGRNRNKTPTPTPPSIPENELGRYRFYIEYAPHQSLQDLMEKYRAWDQLLPEAFLWHVFDSLAAALQTLSKGPDCKFTSKGWARSTVKRWPSDYGILHNDIKPDNIFLGYERWKDNTSEDTGGSALLPYPVIKLADFGLASITGPSDPHNVEDNYWKVTDGHKPPEHAFWGIGWTAPPNHRARMNQGFTTAQQYQDAEVADPAFRYSDAANIWCIGKMMHDLLTLSRWSNLRDHMQTVNEARYQTNGRHFYDANEWRNDAFRRAMDYPTGLLPLPIQPTVYSHELVDLIAHTLRPKIEDRPDVNELRSRTQAGLARIEHEHLSTLPTPPIRRRRKPIRRTRTGKRIAQMNPLTPVYFHDHTINNMQQGPYRYRKYANDYSNLVKRAYVNPNAPPIALPGAKWAAEIYHHANDDIAHSRYPHAYQIVNNRIWFANPPQPNAPGVAGAGAGRGRGGGRGGGGGAGGGGRGGGHGHGGGGGA